MGTTRDMFDAGSSSYVYFMAIEGYPLLITNHSNLSSIADLGHGSWVNAIGGLFVDFAIDQRLDPMNPFCSMGNCTVHVAPDAADTFGIAVGRKTAGNETYLDASIDCNDATITVKSTSLFASSGTIHIGTECITYSGTTATTFTGCTRGRYSPFYTYADTDFGHAHRVILDSNGVKIPPIVSEQPRHWNGRLVGIWAHRVVAGVPDIKAQAELVYAGRIDEVRDDPNTLATVLSIKGILDVFGETTIGSSQWEGAADDVLYLAADQAFEFADNDGSVAVKYPAALAVVVSGATAPYQINQGYWTLTQLATAISTWLAAGKAAGNTYGTYSMASPVTIPGNELRTKIYWTLTNNATFGNSVTWALSMPAVVAKFFGFEQTESAEATSYPSNVIVRRKGPGSATQEHYFQSTPPSRVSVYANGGPDARLRVQTRTGVLVDQIDTFPAKLVANIGGYAIVAPTWEWGLFIVNDDLLVIASFSSLGNGSYDLHTMFPAFSSQIASFLTHSAGPLITASKDDAPLRIRQIYAFESNFYELVKQIAVSTGTLGYNSNEATTYPIGAAIPWDLVSNLADSIRALPGGEGTETIIIEKPTKVSEIFMASLAFRWMFLYWRDGGIQAGSWKFPTANGATVTLTDDNKAEPSGNKVNQRSATTESNQWLRQVNKVRYNRSATDPKGDSYRNTLEFEDGPAVDDAGGATSANTLNLRNTYSEFSGSGASIEELLPNYLARLPLISRPARLITRSIDPRFYFQIGLGDVVLFSDGFARDPATGLRSIVNRPALVVAHRMNLGGLTAPNAKSDMSGEVTLFFTNQNPDRVGGAYVPSADVDDTYNFGAFSNGYDSGNLSLRTYLHRYTESTEDYDASSFAVGDKIRIIERDPADPDSPTYWDRTVSQVTGGFILITAALSSPAWDPAKKYHIGYQPFSAVVTTQTVKSFQADDANGLLLSTTQPFLYGSSSADSTYTANSLTEIEMPPNSMMVDGAGRDVAIEANLGRLVNNLIDYKLAIQSPRLSSTVISNSTYSTGAGRLLVAYWPVFLSYEILSNAVYRYVTVAPWAYSTDGTSTKIRVTLSLERPSFATYYNVPWSGTFSQAEWTGITSTTPGTLADATLTANVKHTYTGQAWVSVECGYKCATRLLAKFIEGARLP